MDKKICPVRQTILFLTTLIGPKGLPDPKGQRISEQILVLVEEIAEGTAGEAHLPAIEDLVKEYNDARNPEQTRMAGMTIQGLLDDHLEIFINHIQTRNCPTHDCGKLAPSPCQMACPAGIDIPTYLALIAQGKDAEAIEVIRRDNPLPWVCGLICTRPCEMMCVRARIDKAISIKFLKAFAAERAMSGRAYTNPTPRPANGKKVCVVGAGPGGLSCAYYLALMGYGVRIIEALPVPGGMLMVGIPRYRLPGEVINREVAMIEALGVKIQYNTRLGRDVTKEELDREGFEAYCIAIGAHKAWTLGIEGEKDFSNVFEAVRFLRDVALGDHRCPGKNVVVVGGGNVAIDAARTSLRLGAERVIIAYRRTRDQMPADVEEVEQAEEEGIEFSFLTIPAAVKGEGQNIHALSCIKAELKAKQGSDRLAPVPIEGGEFEIRADAVISAIGQYVDNEGMDAFTGINWSRRGTIDVNHAHMETAQPGVFAAGDAVSGPATVIEAIGGGKRAADAIDRYLRKIPQPRAPRTPVRHKTEPVLEMTAHRKMTLEPPKMPMLNLYRRRTTFQQVELGYEEADVRQEAARCLRCDICRRCGKCVDICRDKMGINALKLGYLDFDESGPTDFRVTAENCITCGACAANCENNALKIDEKDGRRRLLLCGTILNSQAIRYCESCGAKLGSEEYTRFIAGKTRNMTPATKTRLLCNNCLRRNAAVSNAANSGALPMV
ncbi:FAD-dependent oxidoreductase [Desulfobacter vibrioformis]|uniref:FAD-dependent oxidoreductase n=1 Tax=Desulfobacter vibrioformis TaxID=34031 RepID=UPI000558E68F|nr:FAD-dependent oxidoreductase [Desulfobacter vibrioformis]